MDKKLKERIDQQVQLEYESAYIYMDMAIYFSDHGWDGFSHWMYQQYHEEIEHAENMMHFLLECGEVPVLKDIKAPKTEYKGVLEIFQAAYKHEQAVTKSIHEIVSMAIDAKDYATENYFRKFVDEQVEEEDTVSGIVDRLKIAKNDAGFLHIDFELSQRK